MMPTNKVMVGGAVGALSIIVVWVLKTYAQIDPPADVIAAGQALLTFVTQYVVKDAQA